MSLEVMSRDVWDQVDKFKKEESTRITNNLEEIEKESITRLETFKSNLHSKFQKEINSKRISIVGIAKSKSKSQFLEAQKEVFNTLENNVLNYFQDLDDKELKLFYSHLIKRANEIIKVGLVLCSKSDLKLVKTLVKSGVEVEVSDLIKKGLMFESSDNKESLDLRVEVLLDSTLKEEEEEIISLLLK